METNSGRFDQALALLTVVECGSFTRAAGRLGVSKALVSKQVQALEVALGVRLLERTTRRVALTIAAVALGDLAMLLAEVPLGTDLHVQGFLAPVRKDSVKLK